MEIIKKESEGMVDNEEKEEEDFEIDTLPSLSLPKWKGSPTESKLLMQSLTQMDGSIKTLGKIEQKEDVEGEMEKFSNLSKTMLDRSRTIKLPESCIATTEEYKELKNITFTKSIPEKEAQEGMFKALEIMAIVDLKKLPKENLENIIRLLIAICNDCFKKLGSNNGVIARMELGLLELFTTNEKLQAIENCRKQLEEEIQNSRQRYEKLREEHEALQYQLNQFTEYANRNMNTEVINNLNKDKESLTKKKNMYKDRCFAADKIANEKTEELKKTEADNLVKIGSTKRSKSRT